MQRPPPRSTLFPYTTLFRSLAQRRVRLLGRGGVDARADPALLRRAGQRRHLRRSEEHTSELQSRRDLVCRLLLEKKKNNHNEIVSLDSACASCPQACMCLSA